MNVLLCFVFITCVFFFWSCWFSIYFTCVLFISLFAYSLFRMGKMKVVGSICPKKLREELGF